ncbi:SurA N-terminal domain-containing protein [Sphingomonas mesophila]|uniref:SurA N-terminal domain-containing protein n=1 Tax=Sphingomonas mesophila TaxID=2303576 RepID=UPI0013C30EE9|nr:SurA N-terminal domain-containing protein [Sphingomonas mesophila]
MSKSFLRASVAIILSVAVAGCGDQGKAGPSGQVVAEVDGEEITLSELNSEMLANNLGKESEDPAVRQATVQRLIARKMLVKAAREAGLHKTSQFILSRQRAEENELAGMAQQEVMSKIEPPSREEALKFIKDNPAIFDNRKLMILEQIRFPQPANANDVKFLERAKSLNEVAELLKQAAIRYERTPTVFDTTSVARELADRIDSLPPGEVFIISTGQLVLASVIREKQPAAIPVEARIQYASQILQQRRVSEAIEKQVAQLKSKAKISYQPGFGPKSPEKPTS